MVGTTADVVKVGFAITTPVRPENSYSLKHNDLGRSPHGNRIVIVEANLLRSALLFLVISVYLWEYECSNRFRNLLVS